MISTIRRLALAVVLPAAVMAGCGGSAKKQDATTHTDSPSTTTTHYRVGESCNPKQALAYSTQGFVCKNGKLQHKSQAAPTTTHKNSHTTTSAPQGY